MKPYAIIPNRFADIGCCPGHDWPKLRKLVGTYNSHNSKKMHTKNNDVAKRIRRHVEKQNLAKEIKEL